jgi:hypothetical protein
MPSAHEQLRNVVILRNLTVPKDIAVSIQQLHLDAGLTAALQAKCLVLAKTWASSDSYRA